MPYVKENVRNYIDCEGSPRNAGELNYRITSEIDNYLYTCGRTSYGKLNEVIGVLECAKQELVSSSSSSLRRHQDY
jgi:hypothetical protein